MKISIIIPIKDRSYLLIDTIKSILNQSFTDYEIILIDDHSTENMESVISQFGISKIKHFKNKNHGPGAARNTGFKHATGDFIKFFDSDDLMTSNHLEDQLKTCLENESEAVYGPFFMAKHIENDWQCTEGVIQYNPYPNGKSLNQWMLRGLFIPIPCFLFRKTLLDKIGPWPEDRISSEDWEYLWKVGKHATKICHTNKSAFLYRIHSKQTMIDNLSVGQRYIDKIEHLLNIIQEVEKNKQFSYIDKLYFTGFLSKLIDESLPFISDTAYLNKFKMESHSISKSLFTITEKIGRKLTGTYWPPMRGAVINNKLFKNYLSMI